ncbi:hypothetical protein [Achromobacter kerstersii]|uniref:hypothetical protein n=1 Tax=Achromobacter kerstersii TaxID=1353890 RepID=UPI00320B075F
MLMTQNREAKLVIEGACKNLPPEQSAALHELLDQGRRDIEDGRFVSAAELFASMDTLDKEDKAQMKSASSPVPPAPRKALHLPRISKR